MAFADELTRALASVDNTDGVQDDLSTAFTTFQAALVTAEGNYKAGAGLNAKDVQDNDEKLINLARTCGAQMR